MVGCGKYCVGVVDDKRMMMMMVEKNRKKERKKENHSVRLQESIMTSSVSV